MMSCTCVRMADPSRHEEHQRNDGKHMPHSPLNTICCAIFAQLACTYAIIPPNTVHFSARLTNRVYIIQGICVGD